MSKSNVLTIILLLYLLIISIGRGKDESDFHDYYQASVRFTKGEDIYSFDKIKQAFDSKVTLESIFSDPKLMSILTNQTGTYIYPPLFAYLLIPLTSFEIGTAGQIFSVLQWLCLLIILYYIRTRITDGWTIFFTLLLSFRFLEKHISNNQVGILLVAITLIAVFTRFAVLSGLLLSLAVVIKLTPIIFLFYFLWKRRFSVLVWFLFGMVFWISLPSFPYGDFNWQMLSSWKTNVLLEFANNPAIRAWKNNQSLPATICKYFYQFADPIYLSSMNLPILVLNPDTIKKLVTLSQLLVLTWFGIQVLKGLSDYSLLGILFLLSAVFSGISWIHSFVIFLFPLAYLLSFYGTWNTKVKLGFGIFLLFGIATDPNFLGAKWSNYALGYSSLLYATLGLAYSVANLPQEHLLEDWD